MKVTFEIENGKKVKVKTYADGRVIKYDEKGNEIYAKDSFGNEWWYEYDTNGNRIHYKDSDGFEVWFNTKGNSIHIKYSDGEEWFADDYEERRVRA